MFNSENFVDCHYLRKKTPIGKLDEQPTVHPAQEKEPLKPFPGGVNPLTGTGGGGSIL